MQKNVVVAVLVVALGVAIVVAVQQHRQIDSLKKAVAAAEARRADTARPDIVRPVPTERRAKPLPEPTPVPTPLSDATAALTNQQSGGAFGNLGAMLKDPAMKSMVRSQQKVSLDMLYGSLFKQLNLPPEELEAFKELLLDRQTALMDSSLAMMSGETPAADRVQKAKEVGQIKATYDKKIADFLGAEGYSVFKDYELTQPERAQVSLFKLSVSTADPLTDQQEADLVQAMYEERKRFPESASMKNSAPQPGQFTEEKMAEQMKMLEQMQAQYLERAAAILNPTQLEQFKKSQEQQRAMMAMGMKMAQQMCGQQKAPPPRAATAEP